MGGEGAGRLEDGEEGDRSVVLSGLGLQTGGPASKLKRTRRAREAAGGGLRPKRRGAGSAGREGVEAGEGGSSQVKEGNQGVEACLRR